MKDLIVALSSFCCAIHAFAAENPPTKFDMLQSYYASSSQAASPGDFGRLTECLNASMGDPKTLRSSLGFIVMDKVIVKSTGLSYSASTEKIWAGTTNEIDSNNFTIDMDNTLVKIEGWPSGATQASIVRVRARMLDEEHLVFKLDATDSNEVGYSPINPYYVRYGLCSTETVPNFFDFSLTSR